MLRRGFIGSLLATLAGAVCAPVGRLLPLRQDYVWKDPELRAWIEEQKALNARLREEHAAILAENEELKRQKGGVAFCTREGMYWVDKDSRVSRLWPAAAQEAV